MTARDANADAKAAADEAARLRRIAEAADRALAEAEARRKASAAEPAAAERPTELGGPDGPEPTRYGDWEKKGVVSDF